MKSTDKLYRLVKSLDNKERRHLKLYLTRYNKDNSNLTLLFEAYVKTRTKDEQKLKEKLGHKGVIANLPFYKNKLYNTLLQGLADYHYIGKYPYDLTDNYKLVVLLFEKKMYKECEDIILKTKQLALDSEAYFMVIKLNRFLIVVMNVEKQHLEYLEFQKKLMEENFEMLKKIENYLGYENLAVEARSLHYMYSGNVGIPFQDKAEQLLQHPLLADIGQAQSNLAKLIFLQVRNSLISSTDYLEIAKGFKETIEIFEQSSKFREQRVAPFIDSHLNYMRALILAHEFTVAEKALVIYKELPTKYTYLFDKWLLERRHLYHLRYFLMLYCNWGKSEKILLLLPEIKKDLAQEGERSLSLQNDAVINFHVIKALFIEGVFGECMDWINKFWGHFRGEKNFTIALQACIRLFEILIYLELKNFKLVSSQILSFRRYLQQLDLYNEAERLMISCLNKIVNWHDAEQNVQAKFLTSTLQQMEQLANNSSYTLETFVTYLKSKITGNTFKATYVELLLK